MDREWSLSEPRTLREALNLVVSSGVRTKLDLLAVEFIMALEDIERLAGLASGWFLEKAGELVHLKTLSNVSSEKPTGSGTVVPFSRR